MADRRCDEGASDKGSRAPERRRAGKRENVGLSFTWGEVARRVFVTGPWDLEPCSFCSCSSWP